MYGMYTMIIYNLITNTMNVISERLYVKFRDFKELYLFNKSLSNLAVLLCKTTFSNSLMIHKENTKKINV